MSVFFDPLGGNIVIVPDVITPILSVPPSGKYPVKNLFVDSQTGKMEVEYDDESTGTWNYVLSTPPTGKYSVKNLFVDPTTGKLEVEYDDIPQE